MKINYIKRTFKIHILANKCFWKICVKQPCTRSHFLGLWSICSSPLQTLGFDGKWQESSFITVSREWELEMEAERLEAKSNSIGLLIIIFTPSSYEWVNPGFHLPLQNVVCLLMKIKKTDLIFSKTSRVHF